ncbi:GspH/FimT family pseudopilin [Dyella sp. ASV21]|uniref:GspH/FimT family pseudopilin n=1 Tax=Dyella sp. ASV21 TaxID=2795114 RepID=UPI001E3E68DB|nr:GspH/FimT family pseudopilin [Dyella sp. ASV21]
MVELTVSLLIAGIIVVVAIPNFRSMILSNRLTTASNQVVDAINMARVEAVKRNGTVQLCSDSASANTAASDLLGTQCGTNVGGVVALAVDSQGKPTTDPVADGIDALAAPLKISGSLTPLRFNGQGLGATIGSTAPYSGRVVDICTSNLSSNNHRIVQITAGATVSVVIKTDATCS